MTAHTSDNRPRPNMLTRDQWLDRVLNSGQVTRVSQHLALVIYALAEMAGTDSLSASSRDLERITGWGRSTIHDHLSELEVFINVTFGTGRAKTLFELQASITEAIRTAVVAAVPDTSVVATEPDAIVASGPDTTGCGEPAGHYGSDFVAGEPDTTDLPGFVASQPDAIVATEPDTNFHKKEKIPHTPLKEKTLSLQKEGEELFEEVGPVTPQIALEAFGLYNDLAQKIGLPTARTLTPQRRKSLVARMREHGGLDAWRQALANVERSAFLRGESSGRPGWRADLDFLLQSSRFTKVVEGGYGNGAHAKTDDPAETREQRYARILSEADQSGRRT